MFRDRIDAGRQLSNALKEFKGGDVVVLAIPRGGLPLGRIVANRLNAPLDVVLTKKIGHPYNKEYAIGAVSLEDYMLSDAVGVTKNYITEEVERIRQKLKLRDSIYHKSKNPEVLKGKTVIIVDDGIATGNTLMVTVELVAKKQPGQVVVAVPVASKSAIKKLEASPHVDEIICLMVPSVFRSVGMFYDEFYSVSDEQAIALLEDRETIDEG
ncbi:phosphoribosyltransferase [Flagellimonas allohymeniacidonis]|uniref:Phosphoribosyltransferase n=1 Tax=Flagellimonas allohymeniacidonis TaxID=2517819 RepID=A0A4Q8QF12_9FLAO|nr:phosphoribosyltransferase family protein [Allomuricauda hymeniacidonis]TAI48424.1 phosphoribosyltransferase [Allomuricauda hymeniacidonis]